MLEKKLNEVIGKSLNWHFKPQDGPHLKGVICFDGIGVFKPADADGIPIYWEAKNLKKPSAFNFNDLQPHQIDNLKAISHLCSTAMTLLLVCVDYGRMSKRVYVFRDMDYIFQRKLDKRSILKKEFDKRRNFVLIRKDLINFNEILAMPREWEYEDGAK